MRLNRRSFETRSRSGAPVIPPPARRLPAIVSARIESLHRLSTLSLVNYRTRLSRPGSTTRGRPASRGWSVRCPWLALRGVRISGSGSPGTCTATAPCSRGNEDRCADDSSGMSGLEHGWRATRKSWVMGSVLRLRTDTDAKAVEAVHSQGKAEEPQGLTPGEMGVDDGSQTWAVRRASSGTLAAPGNGGWGSWEGDECLTSRTIR